MTLFTENEYYDETFKEWVGPQEVIEGVAFEDCHFRGCDFREAQFLRCSFRDCKFTDCDLSLVQVNDSVFSEVEMKSTKAAGINWSLAAWETSRFLRPILKFDECDLNYATFFGIKLEKFTATRCQVKEAEFGEAKLHKADFSHSDLARSSFHNADCTAANFTEATHYTIDIRSTTVSGATFSTGEAIALLYPLDIKLV